MDAELTVALRNFCIRVLNGDCTLQETATLPALIALLLGNKNTASGN